MKRSVVDLTHDAPPRGWFESPAAALRRREREAEIERMISRKRARRRAEDESWRERERGLEAQKAKRKDAKRAEVEALRKYAIERDGVFLVRRDTDKKKRYSRKDPKTFRCARRHTFVLEWNDISQQIWCVQCVQNRRLERELKKRRAQPPMSAGSEQDKLLEEARRAMDAHRNARKSGASRKEAKQRAYGKDRKSDPNFAAEDPFDILGLSSDATAGAVKKRFRQLALKYHPDKSDGSASAVEKFMIYQEAYEEVLAILERAARR